MKCLLPKMQLKTLQTDRDITDLLELQAANLPTAISQEEARSQGFVTVQHSPQLLKEMMAAAPQIIIRDRALLAGYALAMPVSMREKIPVLIPMFEQIDQLQLHGKSLSSTPYIVMGQICIAKPYRGEGFFDWLYDGLRMHLSDAYEFIITGVATRNMRSLKAHQRVGFQVLHSYVAPDGEGWELIGWDWG
ncbi:MAG: GNAT family N-acetyltransferase [Bacteroidota bacterium]